MSDSTLVTEELDQYRKNLLAHEGPVEKALRELTLKMPEHNMQISHEQARFMHLILRAIGAVNTLEIGVFTGYSTLVTAKAIPENGKVVACDLSKPWTDIAKTFWKKAGVDHKIDLKIGPALETLKTLFDNGRKETFDFAFIDADKLEYHDYYEACLTLIRPKGVIMFDNAFWEGAVVNPKDNDPSTQAIQNINKMLSTDSRVDAYLVPIGDGVHMACKK